MGSTPPVHRGVTPSFPHDRAVVATVVAVAGVAGLAIGAPLALIRGELPPPRAAIDPGYAALSHDFAALEGAGRFATLAETPAAAGPPHADAAAAPAPRACTELTWPFFDKDCLWGNGDGATSGSYHRRRIVSRLKSPWCSGLLSKEGAYICRPRT